MTTKPSTTTQTRELELLPCPNPVCRSAKVRSGSSLYPFYIYCADCLMKGPREGSDNLGQQWNGLPRAPSTTEQVIRLREALVLAVIPYEAILMDAASRRWIAPKVWRAIEDAVVAARVALQPKAETEGEREQDATS